jgi:hypothetical protein
MILKITPLSTKLLLPVDSSSNWSVLVCPNEMIDMKRLQIAKKIVFFMILIFLD